MKTVWILGASSGLARGAALYFARGGWQVIAGARSFADPAKRIPEKNILSLPLDVTSPESCEQFKREALRFSPVVDAMIYASAILVLGSCEQTGDEEYRQVMETNFLGLEKMVRLVLPCMREQGFGKLVFFSSINGLMGIPFQSAYTASKHAIEGYAECLAMELAPFHIQVSLVEPGDHRGGSSHTRAHAALEDKASPYRGAYEAACAVIAHDEANGAPPEKLAEKLYRHVNKAHMPFRLRVAKPDQHLAVWMHRLLPSAWNMRILRSYYHPKKRKGNK